MKLLLSTTSGISAVLVKGQGKYFKERGYQVIYSCSRAKEAEELVAEEGLIFEPIPFSREIDLFNDIYCLFLACKVLKRHKPDIVNAGTPKAGLIYMIASRVMGIKLKVFTLRGLRSNTLTGVKRSIVRCLEKVSCICSDKIIAISPSLREETLRCGLTSPDKIVVLSKGSSNGVNLKKYLVDDVLITKAHEKKRELCIDPNVFIFGFVGRIVKDKGVEEIIDAFEKLEKEYKIKLLLVGPYESDDLISDNHLQRIKNNNNIIEVGFSNEVPLFTYIFDVLLLASYREGFGNVVIEAAAVGTPAIVSDIPGARDTIEEGKTGLYICPQDVNSLYFAMKFYLENRTVVLDHGEKAKERVIKYFANEIIWREQETLYNILGSK